MGSQLTKVRIEELAPTQGCIGRFEVQLKADRFRLMSAADVHGYLRDKADRGKPVELVKGPKRFFVVDGHHTLSAILEATALRELDLDVVDDLGEHDEPKALWAAMQEEGWVYDRVQGEEVSPLEFPPRLESLADDPFRTMAWLLRKMGAFDDLREPYQEFRIGDFLRQHMVFEPVHLHEYELATIRGFELLRSGVAKEAVGRGKLPGVDPGDDVPDDLLERYYQVLGKARAPRCYRG